VYYNPQNGPDRGAPVSTRWLVVVVASVFLAVLVVTLVLTGDKDESVSPAASPAASPSASASGSPTPSPSPSTTPAASFFATGDLIGGWYWLRDAAHEDTATWEFLALPSSGDLTFVVSVLATDAVDGARGVQARFFFSWRPSAAAEWAGRLPVTLPNVSPADDPVGYTCRGTVTVPRSTVGGTPALVVQISRNDVRDELSPSDGHVAVNAPSVQLKLP
jgi:hypothetical protein